MFRFFDSVDDAVASLSSIVTRLRNLVEKERGKAIEAFLDAQRCRELATEHTANEERAKRIADKLEELLK